MKYIKTKYNTTSKKHKRILARLKAVKTKKDRMEFLRIYVMNEENEFVKRSFGGQHCPKSGSKRHNAKRKHYHHL
jgi:hypothetical protein